MKIKGQFLVSFETDFSDDVSDINTCIYQMQESLLNDGWNNVEVLNVGTQHLEHNEKCRRSLPKGYSCRKRKFRIE